MAADRANQRRMQRLSFDQGLMPWDQVHAEWCRRSGETITRNRVWQIGQRAEAKLRRALASVAADSGFRVGPDGGRS